MFASRTDWPLQTNRLTKELETLKKNGVSVIDLTESNPTRAGFSYPQDKIISALADSEVLAYEPSPKGMLKARKAIADDYHEKGIKVHPEQIFLTASTSEAYSLVFRLLLNPGENVLSPRPSYPLFDFLAGLSDVALHSYPLVDQHGWQIDSKKLADIVTPQTKALILVNPNNPTGSYVKKNELEEINRFARSRHLALIADEVFFDYALQPDSKRAPSFAGNQDVLTFTLSGISKALGLPQMKLGWMVVSGPEELVRSASARLEIICDTYLSVNTPAQIALPEWFCLKEKIQSQILTRIKENREFLVSKLSAHSCKLLQVEGGWYAALQLPDTKSEEEWALEFLRQDHVYVHPGYFFDFDGEAPHVVLSLLPNREVFQEGIKKILMRAQ